MLVAVGYGTEGSAVEVDLAILAGTVGAVPGCGRMTGYGGSTGSHHRPEAVVGTGQCRTGRFEDRTPAESGRWGCWWPVLAWTMRWVSMGWLMGLCCRAGTSGTQHQSPVVDGYHREGCWPW